MKKHMIIWCSVISVLLSSCSYQSDQSSILVSESISDNSGQSQTLTTITSQNTETDSNSIFSGATPSSSEDVSFDNSSEIREESMELPSECLIETGIFNQYNCSLAGNTACGATAGTLILQSISYLSGDELTERMETIRNYSAIGDEYSCGAPQYYLAGFQISNSLNKYLNDNGIDGYHLTNHRTDKSTKQTLMELLATGRPAVLEVCYGNGKALDDFQGYSHWICVNGYRVTDVGVEFRYSDTIAVAENWISSELLDESQMCPTEIFIFSQRDISARLKSR